MRFEYPLIATIGLLVTGILISIAMGPDVIPVPLENESTKSSAMPVPGFEDVPEMVVVEDQMAEPEPEPMAEPEPEPMAESLPTSVSVSLPEGSGSPGCEETDECYIPYSVEISQGGEVIWNNDDVAAHTVTSGTLADGPNSLFDSSLFLSGTTFSHTFDDTGTFDYYCMVHPWMTGQVIVS